LCADKTVRSAIVQAHDNDLILAHSRGGFTHPAQAATDPLCNRFLQEYKGHSSPVQSVLFNAITASRDLLVTRDTAGALYLFSCSLGTLEQMVDDPAEALALMQSMDLVDAASQLSMMAYQLRQLAAFAPGLFQMLNEGQQQQQHPSEGKAPAPPTEFEFAPHPKATHKPKSASAFAQMKSAMKRLQSNFNNKRDGRGRGGAGRHGPSYAATMGPSYFQGNSFAASLGSFASGIDGGSSGSLLDRRTGADAAAQQHILCTYLLNRFLFHQQSAGSSASILSSVQGGTAAAADGAQGNHGTAAIVYRPSLLQRTSGGNHALKALDLHLLANGTATTMTAASATERLRALQLSVYAMDLPQLGTDFTTRYATLSSSASGLHRTSGAPDSKRDAQASWHSLLSCLFDWDTEGVADVLQHQLHCTPPPSQTAFATFSDRAQALCVLFPSHTRAPNRWRFDAECSALHQLSILSALHALLKPSAVDYKSAIQKLHSYYMQQLPRQLPAFREADVNFLTVYALHTAEHVHAPARTLLQGVLERASDEQRRALWRDFSAGYNTPLYTAHPAALLNANLFSMRLLKPPELPLALLMAASPAAYNDIISHRSGGAGGTGEKDAAQGPASGKKSKSLAQFASGASSFFKRGEELFKKKTSSSSSSSSSSSGGGAGAGGSGAEQGVEPSSAGASGPGSPASSSSSLSSGHRSLVTSHSLHNLSSAGVPSSPHHGAAVALAPEYVSDKEMMAALVLCSVAFYAMNARRAAERQGQYQAFLAANGVEEALSDGALPPGRHKPVVLGAPAAFGQQSLAVEVEAKLPFLAHTLLRMLAYQSHMSEGAAIAAGLSPGELVKFALACDLLCRGFGLFKACVPSSSLPLLIRRLQFVSLFSSLAEKALSNAPHFALPSVTGAAAGSSLAQHSPSSTWQSVHGLVYASSRALLLEIGRHHPSMYLFILGKELLLKHVSHASSVERGNYIANLLALLRRYPRQAQVALLDAVHTLIKLLHPSTAAVRSAMLSQCVEQFRSLAAQFPQLAFHPETGKLAIGTGALTYHLTGSKKSSTAAKDSKDSPASASTPPSVSPGVRSSDDMDTGLLVGQGGQTYRPQRSGNPYSILVFDLKTAGKWRILEGHTADVTAVAFHPSGTHVASYCARDGPGGAQPTLRVWKLGESGLLSDLMHSHGKCTRTLMLTPCDLRAAVEHEQLNQLRARVTMHNRRASTLLCSDNVVPVSSAAQAYAAAAAASPVATAVPSVVQELPSQPAPVRPVPVLQRIEDDTSAGVDSPASAPPASASAAASSAAAALPSSVPPPRSISCVGVDDEVEDAGSIVAGRLLSVHLAWKGNVLVLSREDGTTVSYEHKI